MIKMRVYLLTPRSSCIVMVHNERFNILCSWAFVNTTVVDSSRNHMQARYCKAQ